MQKQPTLVCITSEGLSLVEWMKEPNNIYIGKSDVCVIEDPNACIIKKKTFPSVKKSALFGKQKPEAYDNSNWSSPLDEKKYVQFLEKMFEHPNDRVYDFVRIREKNFGIWDESERYRFDIILKTIEDCRHTLSCFMPCCHQSYEEDEDNDG